MCAHGAFDLLHPGHVRLLEQARDFGDILVVAVQSDRLADRLTDESARAETARAGGVAEATAAGARRPINPAAERAEILSALSSVDFVTIVDEPLAEFLKKFRPDVFVCGSEADGRAGSSDSNAPDALERALEEIGCRLVRLPQEPGYSTSLLIERIAGLET